MNDDNHNITFLDLLIMWVGTVVGHIKSKGKSINQNYIAYVQFGDVEGLSRLVFENFQQHRLFWQTLNRNNIATPFYPIEEASPDNLDDWLLIHNQMHESLAKILNLANPFQLLDADWNVEDDFYDWIGVHQDIHQQIAQRLGVQ